MSIEYNFDRAKIELVCAETFVKEKEYDFALESVAKSWTNLLVLIEEICKLKCEAAAAARQTGEN